MRPDGVWRRIRWGNVARLAALIALALVVAAWPRLGDDPPRLPPAEAVPIAGGASEARVRDAGGEGKRARSGERRGGEGERRRAASDGSEGERPRGGKRRPRGGERPHTGKRDGEGQRERGGERRGGEGEPARGGKRGGEGERARGGKRRREGKRGSDGKRPRAGKLPRVVAPMPPPRPAPVDPVAVEFGVP
jgi:hypothetical protein